MLKKVLTVFLILLVLSCNKESQVDIESADFSQLEELAAGTVVQFNMWGGSDQINEWVDGYVATELKNLYDIKLVRVPLDASLSVSKLILEKSTNQNVGDIDLIWINAENFRNAKEGRVLYGPYIDRLPNFSMYIDPESAENDSGYPIEGYELPYGKSQFNYIYDSAVIDDPPNTFNELLSWVKENPGLFAYPEPPDFTGSAFIKQALYALTGGHEQYQGEFNQKLFNEKSEILWDYLNELEPYLWNEGRDYPKDLASLEELFREGKVEFSMSFTQTRAQGMIVDEHYPLSLKSHIFTDGSLSNIHYTAIPFNSSNKAGALVVSNFLISPDAQLSKNDPINWGDFNVLNLDKLSPGNRDRFQNIDLGDATVSIDKLGKYTVPEIPSRYIIALENGWIHNVLNK